MLKIRQHFNRLYITPVFWYGVITFVISYVLTWLLPKEAVVEQTVTADFYGLYLGLGLCTLINLLLIGNGLRFRRE